MTDYTWIRNPHLIYLSTLRGSFSRRCIAPDEVTAYDSVPHFITVASQVHDSAECYICTVTLVIFFCVVKDYHHVQLIIIRGLVCQCHVVYLPTTYEHCKTHWLFKLLMWPVRTKAFIVCVGQRWNFDVSTHENCIFMGLAHSGHRQFSFWMKLLLNCWAVTRYK